MKSIAEIFDNSKELLDSISNFMDKYIGSSLLRKCGITKIVDSVTEKSVYEYADNPISRLIGTTIKDSKFLEKCVSAGQLLTDKILAGFTAASPYRMFETGNFFRDYKKDTFYRFDLMPKANWERLQQETAAGVIRDLESQTDKEHKCALIFDDSLYARTGGKGTDLCGKVFDHNDHRMRTGYRMMTGGWTNSEIFLPFSQILLTTRDENLMVGPDIPVDRRTIRGRRRAAAKEKGTDTVCRMVKEVKKAGIPFDFVLFDTWFSNPAQLVELKSMDVDTIAMIKKNSTKYLWTDPETGNQSRLDVKEIYSRSKKRRGKSRYLLSVNVTVTDSEGNAVPAKLVYARNRSNRKDWVCFVCTDTSLSEREILETYMLRWQIETYFKLTKSYLKLRIECHSTSYDALTSHMVVVAIRYMILAVERFRNSDSRSLEDLFYGVQREIVNELMDCAIVLMIDTLLDSIREYYNASETQIAELVCLFISKLPENWRNRFQTPRVA